MKKILFFIFLLSSLVFKAQSLEDIAEGKIKSLEKLIKLAEKQDIDVLKEKTTVRTAEIFLKFANWDEKNVDVNIKLFKKVQSYRKEAEKMGNDLADFERNDVILMLDTSIKELNNLIDKKTFRKPSPNVDWAKVTLDNDQLTFNNRPVFLADYTWKPNTKELTEFHGNKDGFFLTPTQVINKKGEVRKSILNQLDDKENGAIGFIFMNHKNVPNWAEKEFGPNFKMREDTYTAYDIDNPGAKFLQQSLIKNVVPKVAGKQYSKLGYMLCNEPHFFTQDEGKKKTWASGTVSNYTIDKFKVWLKNKHNSINQLNKLWKSDFKNFEAITIDIPIHINQKGTPKWYDWNLFNMNRVTEWYSFLKTEITKYDPEANVHLKIMPNLWTENKRSHGIDLETLTDLSGIIGNDSGAAHTYIWGKPHDWEKHYIFEWRELCMGYDFMKSVSPDKINFNSELHYLSTVRSRKLDLDPKYARASFWLAHSYGMTASQIWYWPREANGAIGKRTLNDKGYAGSNTQQPRVTNEVAITLIDLNTFSEEIMAMQRQRKSLRVFYSKTAAINKKEHMDDVFELYESLNFEGTPIGFVTENIIKKQYNKNWDVVLIHKTEFITNSELEALQSYLNNGGTVIVDEVSLTKNEYGNPHQKLLKGKGNLIVVNNLDAYKSEAFSILESKNLLSEINITETNKIGVKGCIWKVIKNSSGNHILSVVNVGKSNATLNITLKGANTIACKDLINGVTVSTTPTLKPNEVYFVEVSKK